MLQPIVHSAMAQAAIVEPSAWSPITPSAPSSSACPDRAIPQDVLRQVVSLLPASDLPSCRLVCQDMARAVDHTITSLCITRWASKASIATGFKRLQNVSSISISTKPDWDHIEKLASNMPKLCSLTITDKVNSRISAACAASLTALTRLDLGTNSPQVPIIPLPKRGSVQLPALRAASFSSKHSKGGAAAGTNGTLADIAAFAPNLQQLFCSTLELQPTQAAKLPRCTHLGAQEVLIVGASSKAAGAAAFASGFPRLQVYSCMPETIKIHAEQKHYGKWSLAPVELLNLSKAAHAVRGFGPHVSRSIGGAMQKPSAQLLQLKSLSVRAGMANSANFLGIAALKHLQDLELVFNAPLSRHGPSPSFRATFLRDLQKILQQLKHCTQLKTLALPAALLCSTCCNEGFSAAAAHSELLHTLEAVAAQQQGLQMLAFLDVQWPEFCSYFAESCWSEPVAHQQKVVEQFEKLRDRQQQRQWLQDVIRDDQQRVDHRRSEKDGSAGTSRLVWDLRMGLMCCEGSCVEQHGRGGLWGVYGPDEW